MSTTVDLEKQRAALVALDKSLTTKVSTVAPLRNALQAGVRAEIAAFSVLLDPPPPPPVVVPPPVPVKSPPLAPTNLIFKTTGTTLSASCDATARADGYCLFVDGVKVAWPQVGPGMTPILIATVAAGAHSVTMCAYNGDGDGPSAPSQTIVVSGAVTIPATPVPVPGKLGFTAAEFTWSQLPDLFDQYKIKYGNPLWDGALAHTNMNSWADLQNIWFGSAWKGRSEQMIITFCPFPNGGSLAAAARGDYIPQWTVMLRAIAALFPNAILRFGHEYNCCYPWKASIDLANYKLMWQVWAKLAHSISAGFKTCLNPIFGDGDMPFEQAFPGAGYVDCLAFDVYDFKGGWPSQIMGTATSHGLVNFAAWCKQLGLPGFLAEWGVGTYPSAPAQNGGDDPAFVHGIHDFCIANGIAQIGYDDDNSGIHSDKTDGTFPLSFAAYKADWGRSSGLIAMVKSGITRIDQPLVNNSQGIAASDALRFAKLESRKLVAA